VRSSMNRRPASSTCAPVCALIPHAPSNHASPRSRATPDRRLRGKHSTMQKRATLLRHYTPGFAAQGRRRKRVRLIYGRVRLTDGRVR
jgi:hypothetical protein